MKNNLTLEMIMERFHDWTINLYTKDDTEIIGKYDKYLNYPVEHAEITDMAGDITVSVYLDKNYDEINNFSQISCDIRWCDYELYRKMIEEIENFISVIVKQYKAELISPICAEDMSHAYDGTEWDE